LLAAFLGTAVFAQETAPAAPNMPPPIKLVTPPVAVDDKFVREQFGDQFTLMPEIPGMVADLDGDGVDDLVLAARAKSPMLDEGTFGFKVVDPYNDFFGYGDPHVTAGFGAGDPTRKGEVLLVIHGAGSEAWHAAKPKAKFVLINLPFKSVGMRRVMISKKPVMAIAMEEYGGLKETSAVYWEGNRKKTSGRYKYEPLGAAMD
jgi:hypothetical protein